MQRRASAFTGYTIEATDGKVGVVSDILFEDQNWKMRWFVVDTGSWLLGRKILIHPAALDRADISHRAFPVSLTKRQVEESPDLRTDQPVTRQMEQTLSDYYGYGSVWGEDTYNSHSLGLFGDTRSDGGYRQPYTAPDPDERQLLSVADIIGFPIHALDGDIGHLDDFLVDDDGWTIQCAVVATKNWGFGKHVLISTADIKATNWFDRYIPIEMTRYKIKCSPSWQEPDWSDRPTPLPAASPRPDGSA